MLCEKYPCICRKMARNGRKLAISHSVFMHQILLNNHFECLTFERNVVLKKYASEELKNKHYSLKPS